MAGHFLSHMVWVDAAYASPFYWYMTRAAAFSAYIAMTAAIMLGMLRTIARGAGERLSWIVDELHQFTTLMGFLFVMVHLVTLYLDPFLPFSLLNFVVPINEPYAPTAVTYGIFGLYTLLIIQFSSWFRTRISYRLWRALHYLTFVCFGLVTIHGIQAGSDSGETWMRAVYFGSGASIGFLVLVRLFTAKAPATSAN